MNKLHIFALSCNGAGAYSFGMERSVPVFFPSQLENWDGMFRPSFKSGIELAIKFRPTFWWWWWWWYDTTIDVEFYRPFYLLQITKGTKITGAVHRNHRQLGSAPDPCHGARTTFQDPWLGGKTPSSIPCRCPHLGKGVRPFHPTFLFLPVPMVAI